MVTAALALWATPALHALEARVGDAVWRLGATRHDERRLIVVDIDDRSLQAIGPWPWSRPTVAQLLDKLAAMGTGLQILDVVFTDPRPDDDALLQAVQRHRPVLAQVFAMAPPEASTPGDAPGHAAEQLPQAGQPASPLDWPSCPAPFATAEGHLANHAQLAALGQPPTGRTGHITPSMAHDGIVRHQPAVVCWQGQAYPALGLAAVMQATGENHIRPQRGGLWDAPWSLVGQQQVLPRLPLDEQGNIRIGWRQHPSSFISVPASDVLTGKAPAELFKGAWVLIGSSAFGLNDSIATPYGPTASGLLAHAQIITAWLDGHTPYTPRAAWLLQVAATLTALGLLAALVWRATSTEARAAATENARQRPATLLLPVAGLGCALALWVAHAGLLLHSAIWVGWVVPALAVLLASLAMASAEHLRTRLERQRLFQHLSSYLPAPVAASLALQPPSGAIRAQLRQVTVMFADIRNFSAYCEARPPEEAAAVLHAFFSAATQVVQQHGGVIEAFQGDAILAVWNGEDAPHQPDHANQALASALQLLETSRSLLPDPAPAGLEPLQLGLGLETGQATAGSFGLASRRTHLVMGRTITIANRLVAMTGDLAHPILVGEGLATQVGAQLDTTLNGHTSSAQLESLGTFLLDGLRVPHHVYAVPMALLAPPPPAEPAPATPPSHPA